MNKLMLALSAACLAVVAIVATAVIVSDPGGAESAGPVPSVPLGTHPGENASTDTGNSVRKSGVPRVDYMIDLNSGVMTPLPKAIIRSLGRSGESDRVAPRYAASPDGSQLAYVGIGDEGSLQIFKAGIDGTGVRQVTHDPIGAASPAWSPDGTKIAYEGYSNKDVRQLFVFDVATGESRQITDGTDAVWGPSFTPNGTSLLYTSTLELRTVPVAGGKSTLLIGPGEGLQDASGGSLSPDGSLVTFVGGGWPVPGVGHCGPCRLLANADGTERRLVPGCYESNPAGTWSPEGGRIVCSTTTESGASSVVVVDIATGRPSPVARGRGAIWLDRHTLLVEVA